MAKKLVQIDTKLTNLTGSDVKFEGYKIYLSYFNVFVKFEYVSFFKMKDLFRI